MKTLCIFGIGALIIRTQKISSFKIGICLKLIRFCVPQSSLRQKIIHELYGRGLGRHFGRDKTKTLVQERYSWLQLNRDLHNIMQKC